MQQTIKRILLGAFVLALIAICPGLAQAAENTWLPGFEKDRHVYIDPRLKNHRSDPVSFPGLEEELAKAGNKNNIKIYVVAVESGDDQPPQGVKWGVHALDKMLGQWQVRSDFPTQDYLIIMWVRYKDNPAKGSVAVNAGSRLKGYGMSGAHFDDANGPVTPAVKAYMRTDPQRAILTIVANIDQEVTAAVRAEEERIEHEKFMQALPGIIAKALLALALIGLLIWLTVRFVRARRQARALISAWRAKLDSANDMYTRLYDGYFGFLKEQSNWGSKFKGRTLTDYTRAVKDFADFTTRQKAANRLVDAAERHVSRTYFPMVGGLRRAQALLTAEPVVISGEELPLEMADLFKGVVSKTSYEPDQLLEAMSALFERTNKALASIVRSFEGAEQNKKDIDGLLPQVEAVRAKLPEAGLTFDPYTSRFQQIEKGVATFISILDSDPLEAFTGSEEVEEQVRRLKADLERAISLKAALAAVDAEIARASERAFAVRSQRIGYAYPLAQGENAPQGADQAVFQLVEKDGDPDPVLAEARRFSKQAAELVLTGRLDQSQAAQESARQEAARTFATIDAVLEAKRFIEKQVPAVRGYFDLLLGEQPRAKAAVAELTADFIPANYTGQPDKLKRADGQIAATPQELAKIKAAYDEQRFLAARALTQGLSESVQSARSGLSDIHSRLAELTALRAHARKVTAACAGRLDRLAAKLKDNAFTTSDETESRCKRARDQVVAHEGEVGKPVTDWVKAASTADTLSRTLDEVNTDIDSERAAHEQASRDIEALSTDITSAQSHVNGQYTRQPARDALATAKSTLSEVRSQIKRPRSNWAAIGRQAQSGRVNAKRAAELAQGDRQAAEQAESAISRAEANVSSVDRSYGHGVLADTSAARSYLSRAKSSLSARQYEEAERQADSAYRAADSAERDAQARVAAIVAAIEAERRRREEEERRRREAEEAERRRQEESYRSSTSSWSSSDSSSGSSWSSGGGGYDSGSSGGGGYSSGSGGSDY